MEVERGGVRGNRAAPPEQAWHPDLLQLCLRRVPDELAPRVPEGTQGAAEPRRRCEPWGLEGGPEGLWVRDRGRPLFLLRLGLSSCRKGGLGGLLRNRRQPQQW